MTAIGDPRRAILASHIELDTPWMRVRRDDLADEESPFWVVERPDGIVAVPTTASGEVVFVRIFRHAAQRWSLELPQGGIDPDEDPIAAAIREVNEETGWATDQPAVVGSFYEAADWATPCTTVVRLLAIRRTHAGEAGIETVLLSPEGQSTALAEGRIIDAATLAALLIAGREAE